MTNINNKYNFWLSTTEYDAGLFACLADAAKLNLVTSLRLYAPKGIDQIYQNRWKQLNVDAPLIAISGITVQRGDIVRLAMDIAMSSVSKTEQISNIVISSVRTALAIPEYLTQSDKFTVKIFTTFNHSHLANLIGKSSKTIDQLAESCLKSLNKQFHEKPVKISLWADLLIKVLPELRDKKTRRVLLSTSRFSEYAEFLGIKVVGDTLYTNCNVRFRPTIEDLFSQYRYLSKGNDGCLFLHWSNIIQKSFPLLQKVSARKNMYGVEDFKQLAILCGLVRKNNRLYVDIGSHSRINYFDSINGG